MRSLYKKYIGFQKSFFNNLSILRCWADIIICIALLKSMHHEEYYLHFLNLFASFSRTLLRSVKCKEVNKFVKTEEDKVWEMYNLPLWLCTLYNLYKLRPIPWGKNVLAWEISYLAKCCLILNPKASSWPYVGGWTGFWSGGP